ARAKTCTVTMAMDGDLKIEVSDDGVGLPSTRRAGVGLSSMRERAEEIGGSCVIEAGASGGTRVAAKLPIANG
ncbi:MAG: sensor histidine kinase, partial [Chloroflexota bacterium]|nr:sensor histidine kinase [Chloroflexota bacterium]